MEIMITILFGLTIGVIFFFLGWFVSHKIDENKIDSAKKTAQTIIEEAAKEAETRKREALVEAKEEWYRQKEEFDKETKSTRTELKKTERRLLAKEASLDRKVDVLNKKEKGITTREKAAQSKEKELEQKDQKLNKLINEQSALLEKIAGMTSEEAKEMLAEELREEAEYDAYQRIKDLRESAQKTSEREARNIISCAIQRYAADHVAETTVSVVSLPNDDMKGRIIGREGRNIRAFESQTGIDVVIDDTPEAILISGFDPIRREVAKNAMEKLIQDGRIHPGRIEEIVKKSRDAIEKEIIEVGEEILLDLNIHKVHSELVRLLGCLKYRTSYGQNVLQHSKEVAYLSGLMADELGLKSSLARRAGLLHDIGKAMDHDNQGPHAELGANAAKKYGEDPVVINAIAAHHEDVEFNSEIPVLVAAADALSGARPGARRETLESYIKRLEKIEDIGSSFTGVNKAYAIQAGRELRVIVYPDQLDDTEMMIVSDKIAKNIESTLDYPGQIKITVIRETRAVSYAK